MIKLNRLGIWGIGLVWATVASAQLLIGQTAGFSGAVSVGVTETTDGAKLYLDAVNSQGGVGGQKIELISLDDKFDPKLAAENARVLIEERGVLAMFLNRGTPHTQAIMPLLDKHGVALIAPSSGAMVLHKPVQKYIFNVRATYQREAEKAVAHLNTLGTTRIAVIHVDDSFGTDALAGATKGFATAKITPVALEKFDRAKPDFTALIPTVTRANPQAVMVFGSGSAVVDAISALRAAGSNAQVVTLSNNASSGFVKLLGSNARGVVITQVFPNERAITFPLVREAQALARAKGLQEVSPAMLEGFAAAKVLVEALRRAGNKPSRDRIVSALESMKKFDLGGLEISYSPTDHTGLDFADLSIVGADGRFQR